MQTHKTLQKLILISLLITHTFIPALAKTEITSLRAITRNQSKAPTASTIYVDTDANGAATGLGWTDAFTNVQDALAIAITGDQIWIAEGIYYPDEGTGQVNDSISSTFTLSNPIQLYGGFNGTETNLNERDWENHITVLSGDLEQNDLTDPNGVVTCTENITGSNANNIIVNFTGEHTNTTAIDGMWITAGFANNESLEDAGGGLYNHGYLVVNNAHFMGNRANGAGGAIANIGSGNWVGISLNKVIFSGNAAGGGGGGVALSAYYGSATLTDVTFVNNQATYGGGGIVSVGKTDLIITRTVFINNQASSGGGLANDYGHVELTDTIFAGNQADIEGGGLNSSDGGVYMTNVVFSGNQAERGGGMHNSYSFFRITNTTFAGNRADQGGGLWTLSPEGYSGPSIINSIFWQNADSSGIGTATASIYDWTPLIYPPSDFQYSNIQGCGGSEAWNPICGTDGGYNIDADPSFVTPIHPADAPTTIGDLHLLPSSAVIAAGNQAVCPTNDLDDTPRPAGIPCDMGAFEFSGLAFRKFTDVTTVEPGQIITFSIRVINDLTTTITGGIISDVLPTELNFIGPIELEPADAGNVGSAPPILVSDLTINPIQVIMLTFPISVNQNLPNGTVITNTAQITADEITEPLLSSAKIHIPWETYLPLIVR